MIKRSIFLAIALSVSVLTATTAQADSNYAFQHITTANGLTSNTAMFCIQDDFGFIWVATKDGIFRYDGHEFEALETIDPEGYMGGKVFSMVIDHDGVIWYCTDRNVGFYNTYTNESGVPEFEQTEVYYTICPDNNDNIWFAGLNTTVKYNVVSKTAETFDIQSHQSSQGIAATSDNIVWMTASREIIRYDSLTGEMVNIPFLPDQEFSSGKALVSIISVGDGIMLVSDNDGNLYRFDTWTGGQELFNNRISGVNYVIARSAGEIWVGTSSGLYILDADGMIQDFISDHEEYELSNCNIMSILQDRDYNMWVCTYHGGLNLLTSDEKGIRIFPRISTRNQINGRLVRAITSDSMGNVWVGTEDGGLCIYSPSNGATADLSALNDMTEHNIQSLLNQGKEMWAATYRDGVLVFDTASGRYLRRVPTPANNCTFLLKTREGVVYAGSSNGLLRYEPASMTFESVPETAGLFVHSIMQDSYGSIWLSCFGQGIWQKRSSSNSFIKIFGSGTRFPLASEYITSMYQDDHNRMWVATEGAGVFYFSIGDPDLERIYFGHDQGFPSDIACATIQDKGGRIWISSSLGLVEMDDRTTSIKRVFMDNTTSFCRSFNHNAIYMASDGTIYLGTYNGMVAFNPEELANTVVYPKLYIKKVYIKRGSRDIPFLEEGKSSILSNHLKISHKEASAINISFSSPGYSSMSSPRYEYSLKGKGTNLSNTTSNSSIVLNNLKPGRYTFTAGISGIDYPESTRSIEIEVIPSFFNSLFAKLIYTLLAISLLYFLFRQIKEKRKGEQMLVMNEMEKNKQKELYDSRVSFFSYITHELRTPLTLIKMPVDKLLGDKSIPPQAQEDLQTIQSNTDRLIELSSQFLELSKIKSSDLQLKYENVDVRKIIQKVCDYFPAAIKERNLQMTLDLPKEPVLINTAPEAVEKVMTNLVSNAVKYCSSSIRVSLTRLQNNIVARVNSDGPLISAENAGRIFDPFFRISTQTSELENHKGVGLGLPLSRNMAMALGGSLSLDQNVKDCNSFVFTFPASPVQAEASSLDNAAPPADSENAEEDTGERRIILVVEDAQDLRNYIARELSGSYTIITAVNGKEALGKIRSQKVDMVISDIMMPGMDGRELCRTIKNDMDLSYIPVILLTAIAGPDSQISSLEAGADHYIEKPFSIELLKASIQSLFHSREMMYKQFSESPLTHFNSISGNKMDQQFMVSLREIIFEHMSDENLDVEMLTDLMHTSTSTLYRKVKANTGLKVNEYIKICRLKKAAELLAEGKYKINEVAYLTGFSSASYFATSFAKQFNISPSNFVKSIRNDNVED